MYTKKQLRLDETEEFCEKKEKYVCMSISLKAFDAHMTRSVGVIFKEKAMTTRHLVDPELVAMLDMSPALTRSLPGDECRNACRPARCFRDFRERALRPRPQGCS
jgi:hypothetical protein